MIISSGMAQSVVRETEKVIKRNINFMNSEAKIIASIDQERIGDFHEGALEVLKTKEKVIIKEENLLKGVKPGINLPVYLKEQIVGVIGITGSEDEVGQMGEVIQKMTEILVKEAYLDKQIELEQQAKESFIDEWLAGTWENEQLFTARGWMMDINVYHPRVVLVFELINFSETIYNHLKSLSANVQGELKAQRIRRAVLETIKNYFQQEKDVQAVGTGSSKYTVLFSVNPAKECEKQKEQIRYHVEKIQQLIFRKHGFQAACGIGRYHDGITGVSKSFKEGERAVSFARKSEAKNILFYDEMGLESFIGEISKETRQDFVDRVLKLHQASNEEQLLETLSVFFQSNQSINDAANKLYIHKNTLQYRLKKVKELTGYDPRVLEEAVLLYVAFFMKKIGNKLAPELV